MNYIRHRASDQSPYLQRVKYSKNPMSTNRSETQNHAPLTDPEVKHPHSSSRMRDTTSDREIRSWQSMGVYVYDYAHISKWFLQHGFFTVWH